MQYITQYMSEVLDNYPVDQFEPSWNAANYRNYTELDIDSDDCIYRELQPDERFIIEFDSINIATNDHYILQDIITIVSSYYKESRPIFKIYLKFHNNGIEVEYKAFTVNSNGLYGLKVNGRNIELVTIEDDEIDDWESCPNLVTIKIYKKEIKMKNYKIVDAKVKLVAGMIFESDELSLDVQTDDKVVIKKGNLQQVLTVKETEELIHDNLVGTKVDELPKHILRMMEETTIVAELSFKIDTAKLNIFA